MGGGGPSTLLPSSYPACKLSHCKAMGIRGKQATSIAVFTAVLIFNYALIDVWPLIHETENNDV